MRANRLARWCASLTFGLAIVWLAATLSAKPNPSDRPRAGAVVYLNVTYVYDHYPAFKDAMDSLKEDVASAEKNVTKRRESVKKMQELLEADKSDTEKKIKAEMKLASATADLEKDIKLQRVAFIRREALIYADVYDKVLAQVEQYAKECEISSVVQFNDEKLDDRSDPQKVVKFIGRQCIWHDEQSDITPVILKRMIDKSSQEDTKKKPKDGRSADSETAE